MKKLLLGAAGVVLLVVAGPGRVRPLPQAPGPRRPRLFDRGVRRPRRPRRSRRRRPRRSAGRCTASTRRARATRRRCSSSRRTSRSGSSGPARCSSSRPAVAYGRLYFANAKGVLFARRDEDACGRSGPTAPTAARPPRRRSDNHTVYMTFLNKPPCNATPLRARRRGRRAQRRHRQGALAPDDRPERVLAARARRASSTSATGTATSTRSARPRARRAGPSRPATRSRTRSPTRAAASTSAPTTTTSTR